MRITTYNILLILLVLLFTVVTLGFVFWLLSILATTPFSSFIFLLVIVVCFGLYLLDPLILKKRSKSKHKEEFVVNSYLKLRLEGKKTIIYVDDDPFIQCRSLLLNVPIEEIEDYDSIDELDEKMNEENERKKILKKANITPEEEFRGHCSNLQVWSEWNYDSCLLHSNLAFPLLKKLTEVGDPIARQVFEKEIIERYLSKNRNVIEYLTRGGYLNYVTDSKLSPYIESANFKEEIYFLINLIKGIELMIKAYLKLIDIDPIDKEALMSLGYLYLETSEIKNAVNIFEKILELYPDDVKTLLGIASANFKALELHKALEVYNHVLQKNPENLEAWEGLGNTYRVMGKIKESTHAFKQLKKFNSQFVQ